MSIVGAGINIAQGFLAAGQQEYQGQIAKMNEKIAKENAKRAIERSQIEQEASDRETSHILGEQEAAQSASGLSLTGKSAILTRRSARMLGRLDALNVRQAGEIESYNYKVQQSGFHAQAAASHLSAVGSVIGGFLNAGSTLVGASTSTAPSPAGSPSEGLGGSGGGSVAPSQAISVLY